MQGSINYGSPEQDIGKSIASAMRNAVDTSLEDSAKGATPGHMSFQYNTPKEGEALVEDFKANKKTYGAAKKAEVGLEDKARMKGNNAFGLTDFILAGGGIAEGALTNPMSALKTAIAIAAKKGIEKWGWSTTAAAANSLAAITGEYAPILLNAAGKGSQALAAAHGLLYKQSPGYREKIDTLMGKESPAITAAKAYDTQNGQNEAYGQELIAAKKAISSGKVTPEEADRRLKEAFGKGLQ